MAPGGPKPQKRRTGKCILARGKFITADIIWCGPSGDAIVASDPASLDEEYAEYVDSGQVEEYLDD